MSDRTETTARALLRELVDYEAEAFETGAEVSGADLVDWFADFRESASGVIGAEDPPLFCVVVGDPFDGMWIRGPFPDAGTAEAWAEDNADGELWRVVPIEAEPREPPAAADADASDSRPGE